MSQTILLGDLINIRSGKSRPKLSGDFPVYGGNGIFDSAPEANINEPAVIVGRVGAYCGSVYIEKKPFWLSDNALGVTAKSKTDLGYIYYLLKSINLNNNSVGGAQPLLTQGIINTIQIKAIDVISQQKISKILSDIDEKIEGNRRMNEALEQMGQALFRHYFITNPDAEKWGKIAIGKKLQPRRGKSLQSRNMQNGAVPVVSGGLQPAGYHNESNTKAPVLTVSASGANAGFVALWNEPVWSADSSFIDATITNNVYFYYVFMKTHQDVIYGMQTGSGQPHIYPKHIELLEIPDVPQEGLDKFNDLVSPNFQQIERNKKEIQTLTALRDTLLPRLISGKIKL